MKFDSRLIPFAITVTLMAVIFIFGMIVILVTMQKQRNRKSREYHEALIAEKDRTMSLISQEVHDHIGQMLNVARLNVHWLFNSASDGSKDSIERIGDILDMIIADTNNISHTLNTEYLKKKGLLQSIKEEVDWMNNAKNIQCELSISGITERFDAQVELMLFRIAQEAMSNALKHAEASKIDIQIQYQATSFSMCIGDNGKGFEMQSHYEEGGIGLHNMQDRARIIRGNLHIDSKQGKGTIVSIHLTQPNYYTTKTLEKSA